MLFAKDVYCIILEENNFFGYNILLVIISIDIDWLVQGDTIFGGI